MQPLTVVKSFNEFKYFKISFIEIINWVQVYTFLFNSCIKTLEGFNTVLITISWHIRFDGTLLIKA